MDAYDYKFPELHERYRATLKVGSVWFKSKGEIALGESRKKKIVQIDFTNWVIECDDNRKFELSVWLMNFIPMFGRDAKPVVEYVPARDLNTPIEELELSVRAYNIVSNLSLATLGDIVDRGANQISKARGCGKKVIEDLVECVRAHGGDVDRFLNKR